MPGQIGLNPRRAVATLARYAGAVATGVEVTGMTTAGDRVTVVQSTIGDFHPDALVYATGDISEAWMKPPPARVKGTIAITEPAPFELEAALIDGILIRQLEDGRLLTGSTIDDGDEDPAVRQQTIDGMPVIDRLPGVANAWISVGHFRTGILLAPAAGEAVAAWIIAGRPPASVAGLGLARLGGGG